MPMTGTVQAPGRSSNFKSGATGNGPYTLEATSGVFNNKATDAARRPHSVLDLYFGIRSPNDGNSDTDAKRQTPNGQLPTRNGYADSTYDQTNPNFSHVLNLN